MRIKRIEVLGFKSFCDRAVLNFGEPIVGVVGPNGCGKSNIVDAIRWCMGEQSAKNLRGQAMGDVIFAGSDTRGPAGMAEVSLTFEDVGFSHETLKSALDDEEALADSTRAPGDEESDPASQETDSQELTGEQQDVAAEVAADKAAMAKLAEEAAKAREEAGETPSAAAAAAGVVAVPADDASSSEIVEVAVDGEADVAEVEEEIDPYQATKDAARILADKPPVIDYAKYSEVTITRRLFRDGTSSYFLNKTPCRLRDITDFFLGSGVGTKAYSIIEQGRIGMIVSARAGDRRHIIEEAAGITKFKTKKRAAERKLDQTRQNLLRVSDIVSELAKRLGSLRRQAQKAERYRRYKGEVKDIELWMASHRFLELRAVERILREDLADLTKTLEDVRVELEAKDAKVISERSELAIEERRLTELQEAIFEVENRVRLSESKIEFQTREAGQLDVRCTAAGEEIERLKEQRAIDQADLEAQKVEFEAIDMAVASEGTGAAEREQALQDARSGLTEAKSKLDVARDELGKARSDVARSESSQQSIGGRVSDARGRLERLLEETHGMDERVAEREAMSKGLKEQLATLVQTRLDLGNKSEEFAARKAELDEKVCLCEAEVETLRTEVHRRKSRLQSLKEIHDKYEGFARGTRAVMQHAGDLVQSDGFEIRGLVADVVNAPENLEIAVEAALGDKLGGILVNKAEVGVRAIEYLKETSAGRSAFVPFMVPVGGNGGIAYEDRSGMQATPTGEGVLGAMVDLVTFEADYREVASNLLGQMVVVETLAKALELRALGVTQTLVTLDGDIVDARGVVAGGSRDSQGASVLGQKREIRELEDIVEALERDLTEATATFVSTKSELTKVTKAIEGLRNDRHDGELAITAHERDLSGAQTELEGLRERQARLNSEQLELEDRVGALEHEARIMLELHQTASADMGRLEAEQLGLIEEVQAAQELVDERQMIATEARVRVAQIGEKRASLEAGILRLEKSQEVVGNRVASLTEAIDADSKRSEELRAESKELSEELVGLYEERTTETASLDEGRREYGRRNADIQSDEVLVRELRSQSEKLAKSCGERDVSLGNIGSDRRHLEEGIEDRYHLNLPSIVTEYHLRAQVSAEDEERLSQRRRVIERMGSDINLTAIEEFQTLSERHDFLATQQVDLDSAVSQLEDAIQKINKTSRRLFKETFHLINDKFKEMFPQLFRGGRARLQLTGGEDVDILEAGVEIHAQPPGKKNTTVDQLSGGEKALTAVALLFSIFLIKPSPFCLLDEVDAPLDEANVDRYNEILRAMTDHSQFIVITHNKRTMAVADRLYGVTMQEPGVSKLVTVNLQKVGDKVRAA